MSFIDQLTPIACPLFVIYQIVGEKRKGRLVVDLRVLNVVVVLDVYPLLDQDDIINDINGKQLFTTFDALRFFFQLLVTEEHKDYIVVISPRRLERSNVVLIGFKNSLAFAQRYMDRLFRLYKHFIRAYIDDISIFSNNKKEYIEHVTTVLDILDKVRVYILAKKSFASYLAVRLLGYVVDGEGITKTDDRIDAFKKLKFPNTLESLERYIGIVGQLQKGIVQYIPRIQPLQDRKTKLLAEEKELGTLTETSIKNAKKAFATKARFELIKEETKAFEVL